MICPRCANHKTYVTDTDKSGPIVDRIRRCKACHYIWRTKEIPVFTLMDTKEIQEYEKYITESLTEGKTK